MMETDCRTNGHHLHQSSSLLPSDHATAFSPVLAQEHVNGSAGGHPAYHLQPGRIKIRPVTTLLPDVSAYCDGASCGYCLAGDFTGAPLEHTATAAASCCCSCCPDLALVEEHASAAAAMALEPPPVAVAVMSPEAKERSYVPSGGKAGSSGGGRLRLRGASRSDSTTTGYTVMDDHHYRNLMLGNTSGDPMRYAAAAAAAIGPKQVSFGSSAPHAPALANPPSNLTSKQQQQQQTSGNSNSPSRLGKPVSLNTLDRDCFIIPVTSLDRFLPAGVTLPLAEKRPGGLSVLEVDDPKLCVLLHLMTPMTSIEPDLESPLARPLLQQKSVATEILGEVGSAKSATEGMLLSNMESNAEIPFISYYVINTSQTDPGEFFRGLRMNSLRKFDPAAMRYTASHTMDLFNEVATIARPPLNEPGTKPQRPQATGYIICVYKVFDGDDGEKFEKNWLYWTGARMLYRYLPKSAGLRRITLHKSVSRGDKMYLLLCECSNFLEDLSAAALLIPALRARLCGYTGLYRMTASF